MSFTHVFEKRVGAQVVDYLERTYATRTAVDVATHEMRTALIRLCENPRRLQGMVGLFENRPTYQFTLNSDGTPREILICFCYDPDDPDEARIIITGFMELAG